MGGQTKGLRLLAEVQHRVTDLIMAVCVRVHERARHGQVRHAGARTSAEHYQTTEWRHRHERTNARSDATPPKSLPSLLSISGREGLLFKDMSRHGSVAPAAPRRAHLSPDRVTPGGAPPGTKVETWRETARRHMRSPSLALPDLLHLDAKVDDPARAMPRTGDRGTRTDCESAHGRRVAPVARPYEGGAE